MKKTIKFIYNIVFWISRLSGVSIFVIFLFIILHIKYISLERYSYVAGFFITNFENIIDFFIESLSNMGLNIDVTTLPSIVFSLFSIFCNNSQNIDLLLIALILILMISTIIVRFINKRYKYLVMIEIVTITVYIVMHLIFKQPIMIALVIATPITYILIHLLNKICPIRKVIMLIPVIGEICCTKGIVRHIFKKSSDKITDISILIIALTVSNMACFLFPFKTNEKIENLMINDGTYSTR